MISANCKTFSFVSWNIRGLGDDNKCPVARDALSVACPTVCCLQETKLAATSIAKARSFLPWNLTSFATRDADGSCGGILTAWDDRMLTMVSSTCSVFSLTTKFISTTTNLAFSVTNVYAPSDHALTSDFMAEMVSIAASMTGDWIVIGDFNLIRFPNEKNNANFDRGLAATFNALIHDLAWFELPLRDRLYTWTNNQEVPVLARLDRVFFNSDWNSLFPNSHLSSLPRPISDHNPIVVSAGTSIPTSPIFCFENSWLLDPLFLQTTLPG
jgi:exonuclease III